MDAKTRELVSWRLRRLARNLSWPGAAALVLAAIDTAFYVSTVAPALVHTTALRTEAARLSIEEIRSPMRGTAASDPKAELAAFYAALAQPAHAPDLLRKLHRTAASQGLVVEQGEYRPLADPGGKFTRYQIVIPAKGTYPQVRRFLAQASRDVPGLALDGVSFQRRQVGDGALEAQIKFTLFLGAQG